jgi:hypothetical protein
MFACLEKEKPSMSRRPAESLGPRGMRPSWSFPLAGWLALGWEKDEAGQRILQLHGGRRPDS